MSIKTLRVKGCHIWFMKIAENNEKNITKNVLLDMKKRMTETSIAIEIWLGLIILFLIYKYIDTLIIKWPLMIFTGGAFFYGILETCKQVLINNIEEASITGKIPTLKDGIKNWSKAIFFVILFLISLLLSFPDLADKYIFCRGADEGKQPVSSGCYDNGREYLTEEELK